MTLITIDLQIAGCEEIRFNVIRIRILPSFWYYVIPIDAVVVSTQSLGMVHVLRMNADRQ